MIEGGFVTTQYINWHGKIYKAQPEPKAGNLCTGCAFRGDGECRKPKDLRDYTCIGAVRSDRKGIIWVKDN